MWYDPPKTIQYQPNELIISWRRVLFEKRTAPQPIPVAAWSKALVCGRPLAGIVGFNPTGSVDICLFWVLCVVKQRSLHWADHLSREVLLCVVYITECEHESLIMRPWPTGAVVPWRKKKVQVVNKFPAIYGNWRFITMFTTACLIFRSRMALKTVQYYHFVTVTQLFQKQTSQNTFFYYKNNYIFAKIHYVFGPIRSSLGEAVTKIYNGRQK